MSSRATPGVGVVASWLAMAASALCLCCLSHPAAAQAEDEGPDLRAYVLEIILFRPLNRSDLDERQWREAQAAAQAAAAAEAEALKELERLEGETAIDDPSAMLMPPPEETPNVDRPPLAESEPFADGFGYLTDEVLPPVYRFEAPLPERFADMAEDTRELTTLFDRLRRSSAYEPLLHERWLQVTYPRDVANTRPLALEREDLAVTGTVKLAVERRLHLELDLTFSQPDMVDYRLQQTRVMTSGELHYIDHPAFGAVCRVTPAELPEGYPDALLADLLQDARLYAADPERRLQSLPWPEPPPPMPDTEEDLPPADGEPVTPDTAPEAP